MFKPDNFQPVETEPPTFTVLSSIQLRFLTTPEQINDTISIMRTVVSPGAVIPLHSHADQEIFYVLDGSLEVFQEIDGHGRWATFTPGEIASIAGGTKHATCKSSHRPVICLVVTKKELYSFLRELSCPLGKEQRTGPPTTEEMEKLFAAASKYGYQLATPQENAAIGLFLDQQVEAS